jgi:hypothetical protein
VYARQTRCIFPSNQYHRLQFMFNNTKGSQTRLNYSDLTSGDHMLVLAEQQIVVGIFVGILTQLNGNHLLAFTLPLDDVTKCAVPTFSVRIVNNRASTTLNLVEIGCFLKKMYTYTLDTEHEFVLS